MPAYRFEAIDADGKTQNGLLDGDNAKAVRSMLRARGLVPMDVADPTVRASIQQRAQTIGWPALHAELSHIDPVTAARLPPGDSQRIGRALEVWHQTGRPLSSWHTMNSIALHADSTGAGGSFRTHHGWTVTLLTLEPSERSWLHRRIAARWDAMMATGLLDEVRQLRQRVGLHAELPALRAVGYRQAWQHLDALDQQAIGAATPPQADPEWLREHGIAATRQLAKRQLTWLRSLPWRSQLACDSGDVLPRLIDAARTAINAGNN